MLEIKGYWYFLLGALVTFSTAKHIIPENGQRIVGGNVATISQYPHSVAMLHNFRGTSDFVHECGGTILTVRHILSVAHCFVSLAGDVNDASWWQVRAGSSFANSGGTVLPVASIKPHEDFDLIHLNDIAIIQTLGQFVISSVIQPAPISSNFYFLLDNEPIWAVGWGLTSAFGTKPEQLQQVELRSINQNTCNERYGNIIADSMLCAGWLDVGGMDQCVGDEGSPMYHKQIVVALTSWGPGCGDSYYPGVNTRISSFANWIRMTLVGLRNQKE